MDRPWAVTFDPISIRLSAPCKRSGGRAFSWGSHPVNGRYVSLLPACFWPVSHHRGCPTSVWISPSANPPFVLSRVQLHRPLAAHQHILERFHHEAGVLSELFSATAMGW